MCCNERLLKKMKDLKVIVDIQPPFISNTNIDWSIDRLGPGRIQWAYPWKTYINNGLVLTGGSDSPVEIFDPLWGIFSIVNRQAADGHPAGGFQPQERVSVYEALCMYTKNAAYASFEEHVFGTDTLGRDLFKRVIYGLRVSMVVGFMTALASCILGIVLGLLSGYFSFLDDVIMRICDGLMAIPAILMAIVMMASLGPTIVDVIFSLVVVYTPRVARIARAMTLSVKEQTYIEAIQALGASWNVWDSGNHYDRTFFRSGWIVIYGQYYFIYEPNYRISFT